VKNSHRTKQLTRGEASALANDTWSAFLDLISLALQKGFTLEDQTKGRGPSATLPKQGKNSTDHFFAGFTQEITDPTEKTSLVGQYLPQEKATAIPALS
jgi:hypothetical protein